MADSPSTIKLKAFEHAVHNGPPSMTMLPSGKLINLLKVTPEDIVLEDVLTSLRQNNRFGGSSVFNVLWHEGVTITLAKTDRMRDLMAVHDGHEYLIGDIISPLIKALDYYRGDEEVSSSLSRFKHYLDVSIYKRFGVAMPNDEEKATMRDLDRQALIIEARYIGDYNEGDHMAGRRTLDGYNYEEEARARLTKLYVNGEG